MKLLLLALIAFTSLPTQAYFSMQNHGDVIKRGHYRVSFSPQFITSSDLGEGANFTGRFDTGIDDASDLRIQAGGGRVNFHTGGLYKWVPIPDTADQPALGVMSGAYYARQNSVGTFSVRAFPFISKHFDTVAGTFVPYASLPFGLSATSSTTEAPVQILAGSEWMPPGLERISFWAEMGFNVSKAFSYVTLAVSLYWDDTSGVQFK